MRKTNTTIFGLVGTDWVRITRAILDTQARAWVRADGSNAVLPFMPTAFRTSGDIANVVATLGHRVNMAAVPSVALPAHTWKKAMSLDELAAHPHLGFSASEKAALIATYTQDVELIAA